MQPKFGSVLNAFAHNFTILNVFYKFFLGRERNFVQFLVFSVLSWKKTGYYFLNYKESFFSFLYKKHFKECPCFKSCTFMIQKSFVIFIFYFKNIIRYNLRKIKFFLQEDKVIDIIDALICSANSDKYLDISLFNGV